MALVRQSLTALMVLCGMTACNAAFVPASRPLLQTSRQEANDLEIGGSLEGVPKGQTRFVSYNELLKLPQQSYIVSDDSNFGRTVQISGIALEKLPALLGAEPDASMVIAVCDDNYAAHYPASYLKEHHPLLVLKVNGKAPDEWPVGIDGVPMGPYMVSHASYTPAFHILSHKDEPQIPWGVVRIEVRREIDVYAPIEPRGAPANDPVVQQGYAIASQSCFRCHSRQGQGGMKSPRRWEDLARIALSDPKYFNAYVRAPKTINSASKMAASPWYDDATLYALRKYFATFAEGTP